MQGYLSPSGRDCPMWVGVRALPPSQAGWGVSSSLPPGRPLQPQLRKRQSCHYKYTSDLFHGGGKVPTRPKICIRSTHWLEVAWLPVSVSGVQLCCGKPSSFSTVLLRAKNMMKPELNVFFMSHYSKHHKLFTHE